MPETPDEDALIDSFEEEHPEEPTPEAGARAGGDAPRGAPKKNATPKAAPAATDAPDATAEATAEATADVPIQEHEEIEDAKGTETAENLATSPQPTETLTSLQELPLEVSVEVSRLEMNFKTLSELKPGNLLELATRPENGVHLVVNGQKLARGELIRVGQLLGIRILEIKK
jgi:type III secretion system YscQ/HrcQ family protein